jgi:hypothetical protein
MQLICRHRHIAFLQTACVLLVAGGCIARAPVLMDGRIELLQYLKEQSVCNSYHRYGNLGERECS